MRRLPAFALLVALAVLPACGSTADGPDASGATESGTPSPSPSSTPTPSESPTPAPGPPSTEAAQSPTDDPSPVEVEPTAAGSGYAADCAARGEVAERLARLDPQQTVVANGEGSRLAVTTAGSGSTVVVLLHQLNGGACGWQQLLARAGADDRFRFVAPDLCGSGRSACVGEFTLDDIAQTKLVLDWVRKTYHPDRVTVMGASMGGAIVVRAAGIGLPIAAGVDISGPDGWFNGASIATDIRRATVPLLLAYDPADDPGTAAVAEREAARSDRVRYLELHDGHGWANLTATDGRLTPAARTMLDFLAG